MTEPLNKITNRESNPTTNIFIYTHKDFTPPVTNKAYVILTESDIPNKGLTVNDVRTGHNIQKMGPCYSELKGLYWVWKNIKNLPEFVGFNHYRRYFAFRDDIPVFDKEQVVVYPPVNVVNIRTNYGRCHRLSDIDLCCNIVKSLYPDYIPTVDRVLNSNSLYICNCFVMHRDNFIKYMEWLFTVLFRFDKERGFDCYDDVRKYVDATPEYKLPGQPLTYQYRLEGFLGERLFTIWLTHNFSGRITHIGMLQTK